MAADETNPDDVGLWSVTLLLKDEGVAAEQRYAGISCPGREDEIKRFQKEMRDFPYDVDWFRRSFKY